MIFLFPTVALSEVKDIVLDQYPALHCVLTVQDIGRLSKVNCFWDYVNLLLWLQINSAHILYCFLKLLTGLVVLSLARHTERVDVETKIPRHRVQQQYRERPVWVVVVH